MKKNVSSGHSVLESLAGGRLGHISADASLERHRADFGVALLAGRGLEGAAGRGGGGGGGAGGAGGRGGRAQGGRAGSVLGAALLALHPLLAEPAHARPVDLHCRPVLSAIIVDIAICD